MRKLFRRSTGLILSIALLCAMIFPHLPAKEVLADTGVVEAWGEGWHYYCIDGFGYASNGVCSNGDKYKRVSTEAELNSRERAVVFWSLLSFMSAYVHQEAAAAAVASINQGASAAGLRRIERAVTEEDLKAVIHSSSVRARYDWLDYAADHGEEYLKLAGLLGGSSQTGGRGEIPAILKSATSLSAAVRAVDQDGTLVLEFDSSGKDGDFIEKVPLKLSADGENWQEESVNGWNVEKSSTQIRLTNPNPDAGAIYLKFDPAGTDYALSSGGYGSADECYTSSVEVWKCVECCRTHFAGGKEHPLAEHQRNAWLELKQVPAVYYAMAGDGKGSLAGEAEGELHFQIYRHEEEMEADYLVQLYKYDYETGKPLEGAGFDLYERFDDKEEVNREQDGRGQIYEGEIRHSPVIWDGFRLVASLRTDSAGRAAYKSEKQYHYDKTFCDGHPAPVFAAVPEEIVDDETGEVINEGEIESAKAANGELAEQWLACVASCEEKTQEGSHFHWIMDEVDAGAIEDSAGFGECTYAGVTESADPEKAYESSGCQADCRETYERFVSMKYSYTFMETTAREGYVLHGSHNDDIPIEIITTDASQNGAHGAFGGGYSKDITGSILFTGAQWEQEDSPEKRNVSEGQAETGGYYTEEIKRKAEQIMSKALIGYESNEEESREETDTGSDEERENRATALNGERKNRATVLNGEKEERAAASGGNRENTATVSDGEREKAGKATSSEGIRKRSFLFRFAENLAGTLGRNQRDGARDDGRSGRGTELFARAYAEALHSASKGEEAEKGPSDRYSHNNGQDGREEAWRIYDHRTEGEIHINKKDMDLSRGETQGDGTLEGAVYGLFAAQDLIHPDGATGVVFRQNDLVAITATDKEGDGSFMAITEMPGCTYDYKTGQVIRTDDGWTGQAPSNLYVSDSRIDDYSGDHAYVRSYTDYQSQNGNCWIGRPLLLGSYYVKELSRSEGYELSVNGRSDKVSNYGYSTKVAIPRGRGSVAVVRAPYVEPQSSGKEEDTMPNVVNFVIRSQGTGEQGYDIALPSFPRGTRLYRKDMSQKETELQVPAGEKVKKYLFDQSGQPVYQRADADHTYAKRNPDGTFVTRDVAVSAVVPSMGKAAVQTIDEETVKEVLDEDPDGENSKKLNLDGQDKKQFLYVKMKVEQALRACGYQTPRYSTETKGVYDRGVRQGETDHKGLSGVLPGEPASKTVYGYPVIKVEIPKKTGDNRPVTVMEAILTLLDFYRENPWYSFGGIDSYRESESNWQFSLYAGVAGNPANYIVLTDSEEESMIYHRLPWLPDDGDESPRWIYALYTNVPDKQAFGTYENFRSWQILGSYRCSAVLVSDAVAEGDGTLCSKTQKQNVYYEKGEILRDPDGNPLQAYEWTDVMVPVTQYQQVYTWTEIPVKDRKGQLTSHGSGSYTDAYGVLQKDTDEAMNTAYKLVLPQSSVTLTREDIGKLPVSYGYQAGETMGAGDYALTVLGAGVLTYLDYDTQTLTGDSLYVRPVSLTYPGQDSHYQDGDGAPGQGTRKNPVEVEERIIRQSAKILKTVKEDSAVKAIDNFRFKIYLKSNLERLYRDEEGNVLWVDRKGKTVVPQEVLREYPALVPKLYTKVTHNTAPLYKDSLESVKANKALYGFRNGIINDSSNPGYTAILETDTASSLGEGRNYNYEKFFDAILTANIDKWKNPSPSHTSHRPLGNEANRSGEAEENAEVTDSVRQFAVNWYLDEEVKKLKKADKKSDSGNDAAYSDELYDSALWEAIKKSENYLKPFFAYNIDQLYAIEWDGEKDGGRDKDKTTLSTDQKEGNQCFALSQYLPYGTYVVVEQQPMYAELGDFRNRHYDIDKPKEMEVPAAYESREGALTDPAKMNHFYDYNQEDSPEEQAGKYKIRFHEESHVINAHNHYGDFQIYKYGMDIKNIANGVSKEAGKGDYFALTQSLYKPYQNYYNEEDDRTTKDVPYYLTEGMSGREKVSAVYRFSSVSENGKAGAMTGVSTAYDGRYASALVPWTMAVPADESSSLKPLPDGESSYKGLAYKEFTNVPYKSRLRIEKLDSETHENLLHDGAMFRIYRAQREESPYGDGAVKVCQEETLMVGSREFLMGMGAANITKVARGSLTAGLLYSGFVPAGTPVCQEKDQVVFYDQYGAKTGEFKACTTTRDGLLEKGSGQEYGDQNAGYLETPEELEAGVYVLAEAAPPSGYTRTKPVAVEIYSDNVAYYKEGNPRTKVLSVIYEKLKDLKSHTARIYVENAPIKVRIHKKKKSADTVTYLLSGRIDGSLSEIGGDPSCEYAYSQGDYLGYGWKKGILEYLQQRKEAGDQVDIIYHQGVFAGYGYITKRLEKKEHENPYVAGAAMALYEGIELKPSGDREDYGYEGLTVERSLTGNVTRMYVKEGYAGTRIEFRQTTDGNQESYWDAVTVERQDTDILYYDLGDLDIFAKRTIGGHVISYGYDKDHHLVNLEHLEEDRKNVARTDREHSIFAFKGGIPYLELTGDDFTGMSYDASDHILTLPSRAVVYHLDRDGNRDAMVDPITGMAYVMEEGRGKIYVWPVKVTKGSDGRTIAADKIVTCRVATIGENPEKQSEENSQEEGYVTGTWRQEGGEESHSMYTIISNERGDNMEGEAILHHNTGNFEKYLRPVLDEHGLPIYYKAGGGVYAQKTTLCDRDGDFVRSKRTDLLEDFKRASYVIGGSDAKDEPVTHRLGESYLLENTWITGEGTPNDPFDFSMTEGQPDLLKRVPAGSYIMEEIKAPPGCIKGLPVGMTIKETAAVQTGQMTDDHTKILFQKRDTSENYEYEVLDMGLTHKTGAHKVIGTVKEGKGSFSHGQISGAGLVLCDEKGKEILAWETTKTPYYLEGLAQGKYMVKENKTPKGFVACDPVHVETDDTGQVQVVDIVNDHTKVEIEKYSLDGTQTVPVEGVGFALYEADNHTLSYDREKQVDTWETGDRIVYQEFIRAFEKMYGEYGTKGRKVSWSAKGKDYTAGYVSHKQIDPVEGNTAFPASAEMIFSTEEGKRIRIVACEQHDNGQGRDFTYEYQFDYKKLPVSDYAVSFETVEGIRRFDYLPAGKSFVLVEEKTPAGYGKAPDRLITVENTADIQRHRVLNQDSRLLISKCAKREGDQEEDIKELPGAELALYRADDRGELSQDDSHLAAQWISGTDGIYTEEDWVNGRIPKGYEAGDLKPHELKKLPSGIYYLAELKSPAYYSLMEPVRIQYSQEEQIQIVRAFNEAVKGELEVAKKDGQGQMLKGVLFELAAYKESQKNTPVFTMKISDHEGKIAVSDLPVGEIQEDGTIVPYQYRLKEITPPEGYASDMEIHTFQFQPDVHGVSYTYGQKAEETFNIVNEKTKIAIGKKEFGSPDQWVAGAVMAVYEGKGRDEKGEYIYEETPIDTWISKEEEPHILEGLTAGRTYLLTEQKAPNGYELMNPLAFVLSADGRKICAVTGQTGQILVHPYEGSDIIRSVEIQGRYGVKVEMELENQKGEVIASWTAGGYGHELREADGIRDGELCRLTETTVYSDGTRAVTGRTTRRVHLSEKGVWKVPDRNVEKVNLELAHEDGMVIKSWNPSEMIQVMEVDNPAAPENPEITIDYVSPQKAVWVTVACSNTTHYPADITLTAKPGAESVVIDSGEGLAENGRIRYTLKQVKPGERRTVRYACQLEPGAKEISVSVASQCAGIRAQEEKRIPLHQKNRLTVFYQVTGTGKRTETGQDREFQVFLYSEEGEELKGSYEYEGSKKGNIRSGDVISLSANDYIVINPGSIYRNIRYQVRYLSEDEAKVQNGSGQAAADTGAIAVFSREVTDHTQAAVFQKGNAYEITETTRYSDGTARESHKLRFILDDQISIEGVQVMDRRQEIRVSKLEIRGQEELEGAHMQIMKEDRTLVEEWISGKAPYRVQSVLEPGKTYILREEGPPEGYSYGEEIEFQVEEGECVNQIIMEDYMTEVIVSKKTLTGEDELPGAFMQIISRDGQVVEEWISDTKPHKIRGKLKAGETYILHEEGTPEGYAYAADLEFTVSKNREPVRAEMRDGPTCVEITKTDMTGSEELEGAVLQVIDKNGQVIEEWVSKKEPHKITGVLKAGETYILREKAAPEGYGYAADAEFTVSLDGSVCKTVMKDDITRVEIIKADQGTGRPLSGAGFKLQTLDGKVVEEWVSSEEPHKIEGRLKAGETYLLKETKAPAGYRSEEKELQITVPKEPKTLTVKVENRRKTTTSKVPPGPDKKEKKIGKVYAGYWSELRAHGERDTFQTFTNLELPKVGDSPRILWVWIMGILSACLTAILAAKKRKTGKFLMGLGLCMLMGISFPAAAKAETVEADGEGRIIVTGEVCGEKNSEPKQLPETYYYKSTQYRRQSYQIVEAMTEAGTKEVRDEIIYEEVEQTDSLPEETDILVTDQRYGTEYVRRFPVLDVEFYNWRWISGFEFPVIVEEADAQVYDLNGIQVPAREEKPFQGYEDALLSLAQVNPEYYRILEVTWAGEPWIADNGKVYREAVAAGEKYVADCKAVYGGTAVIEPVKGTAWQAVYERVPQETEPPEEKKPELETKESRALEETVQNKAEESRPLSWYQTRIGRIVISIGLFFLFLPIFIWIVIRRKRSKEKQRKSFKK